LIKENCPTINQTVKKPSAIIEFKLSIGMELFLVEVVNNPSVRQRNIIHAAEDGIGFCDQEK